ncbi:GNAT domain containing protein [uncultured Caudovirales phage]|uniref:GNAT domain containing protein n=1 Tax=uncultured Caudovirales phage TaxID=2100421 RepID=A0A6J5N5U8_9CAUD|nr:GNAT domain containing protein [uncultured Caudovirales phage]
MIAIRALQSGEEPELIALAQSMQEESPVYRPYPFSADRLMTWVNLCLTDADWLCLMAWNEDGKAIGFIAVGSMPMMFSNARTVDDLGIYVIPAWRGTTTALRLVRQMEGWASSKAQVIRLGVTTGTNKDQTVKFLERLGYKQTGILLTKQT